MELWTKNFIKCNKTVLLKILNEKPRHTTFLNGNAELASVSSVRFSHSVVSDSLQPHEPQHARPPCPHQLPEFTQTHAHWVGDAIKPSHSPSSSSPPALNLSQHQGLFKWVSSFHQVKHWSFSFNISPSNEPTRQILFKTFNLCMNGKVSEPLYSPSE